MEQFRQALAKGMPQLQDWRSLESAMPAQLQQVAKSLGLGSGALKDYGANGQGLYNAMQDGKITLDDFNNTLLKLDKTGLGTLPNFQQQAKNASNGVATSFTVLKQSIQQVMVDIMTSIGQQNIANAIKSIGTGIQTLYKDVKALVKFVVAEKDIFTPIAVGIGAATAAIILWNAALTVQGWVRAFSVLKLGAAAFLQLENQGRLVAAAQWAINAAMSANPIAVVILAITALTAGLTYFFAKTETGQKIWASFVSFLGGVWSKIKAGAASVGDFFSRVWDKIKVGVDAVKTAFDAVSGAVTGFVGGALNVLNTALQATIGWLVKNYKWFENIGIIVGTILLPSLMKLGIQAVVAAAKWVASMATAGASTTVAAAKATVSFVQMSAAATVNAAKATAAWVASAARTAFVWVTQTLPQLIANFAVASAQATVNAVRTGAAWVLAAGQTIAAWAVTIAAYLAQVALAAAQTFAAGVRMAAAWLLAMGPIGLIVAVVAGAVALIIANWNRVGPFFTGLWNGIKNVVAGVINWIKANWPLLLAIITGPIGIAVLLISRHWQAIKNGAASAINSVASFFGGLPGRILGAIGNLGSLLYNSGRSLIQGLLNGAGSLLSSIGSFFLDKLPGWIRGPFKRALGIHSPSTVFAGYGGNITAGLAQGIDKTAGTVTKAVGGMADAAVNAMAGTQLTADPSAALSNVPKAGSYTPGWRGDAGKTTTNTFTGPIYLGDQGAVKQFFKELNQDTINVGMGLTPNQGAI